MADSDSFERDYNDIKKYLVEITNSDINTSFPDLIDAAITDNLIIRKYASILKDLNRLRNIIVHSKCRRSPQIAEPTKHAVKIINEISNFLLDPPKVIPLFQKKVFILQEDESISDAVEIMYSKNFSQIPIYEGEKFIGLLTTNTIVRWLGACVKDEIVDLKDNKINDIFEKYIEDKNNYFFLKKNDTLFKAIEKFQNFEDKGSRLDAILITENGYENEKLLGIITVWDLPDINKKLGFVK